MHACMHVCVCVCLRALVCYLKKLHSDNRSYEVSIFYKIWTPVSVVYIRLLYIHSVRRGNQQPCLKMFGQLPQKLVGFFPVFEYRPQLCESLSTRYYNICVHYCYNLIATDNIWKLFINNPSETYLITELFIEGSIYLKFNYLLEIIISIL